MTEDKAKNEVSGSILTYLDSMIMGYYKKQGNYPNAIITSEETKDKIFKELELEADVKTSWADRKGNYRGIEIKIKENIFIELE